MQLPIHLESLTPREAVADAVYRTIQGFDSDNVELFESGMAEDSTFVINDNVIEGRDNIRKNSFDRVGKMDTTHFVTNPRIYIKPNGTEAQMTANALSQHYRPGEGRKEAPRYLVGSGYEIDLVKDSSAEGLWKVKKWVLNVVWTEGDAKVMSE